MKSNDKERVQALMKCAARIATIGGDDPTRLDLETVGVLLGFAGMVPGTGPKTLEMLDTVRLGAAHRLASGDYVGGEAEAVQS